MTVIMTVVRMGPFFPLKVRHGQTSTPPTIMQLVSTETLLGMRSLAVLSSRLSTSAVTASTTAPRSPPHRRARSVRVPRGGKGSPSPVPSSSPSLSVVAASLGSVASRPVLPSVSPVSGAVEASSPESAVPGWVPGSMSG